MSRVCVGSGLQVFVGTRFQELMTTIGEESTRLRKEDQRDSYQAWTRFQRAAFKSGASIAHRVSKVRPTDQIAPFNRRPGGAQPKALANQNMQTWREVWTKHGCLPIDPPADADSWPPLPGIDVATIRKVILTFPKKTSTSVVALARWGSS
eukprot:3103636-Pyramimonas_sp.AAC.1